METILGSKITLERDRELNVDAECLTLMNLAYLDRLRQIKRILRACKDKEGVSRPGHASIINKYKLLLETLARAGSVVVCMPKRNQAVR